jgi:hypothetical protein
MSAILDITKPPDLFDTMSPDRRRKIETPDSSPWPSVVMSAVPAAVTENKVVVPIVNDVVGGAIRYRVPIIVQIDEIRPVREEK